MPRHRFNSLPITPSIQFGCAVMSFYDTNLSEACILFSVHPYRHLPCTLRRHINAGPWRSCGETTSLITMLPDGQ